MATQTHAPAVAATTKADPTLSAAMAALSVSKPATADEELHVPVSTGADILKCVKADAAVSTSTSAGAGAAAAASKPCAVAAAVKAAPCAIMAAIKSAVGLGAPAAAAAGAGADKPCSSLTSMSSVDPPIVIKPVTDAKVQDATAPVIAADKKLSLQELVHNISQELNRPDKCMKRVRSLMERYDASAGEWKRYAFWDAKTNYTRNLIATDQKTFTLMQLCWNPSKWSPCHDHNGSECFMRMVEGQLIEVRYQWPDPKADQSQPLHIVSQTTLQPGSVCFINDSLGLHKVGNPSASVQAVSLHCYIPGYDTCKAWCQPDKSAKCVEANISFYSELGKKSCH